jgi:hydrogenase maturation protein HypF
MPATKDLFSPWRERAGDYARLRFSLGGGSAAVIEGPGVVPDSKVKGENLFVQADAATCPDCLREVQSPSSRRFRYPFTTCGHCGPRYSILRAMPHVRSNTSMDRFVMCDACRAECDEGKGRRYGSASNACPACGPQVALWDERGSVLWEQDDALIAAAQAIASGAIVAVKGLTGFHLLCDARNDEAVAALRARKHSPEKPLPVMFGVIDEVRRVCRISQLEECLLTSSESPIVLLSRTEASADIAAGVAPGRPDLGAMLPATALHHVLLGELGFPVVATSANIAGEPPCRDEEEALKRLWGVADLFLVHDREIVNPADDSIVREVMGREMVLRRGRGCTPVPITVPAVVSGVLAVGGQQECTVAASVGHNVVISPPLGDLDTRQGCETFRSALGIMPGLFAHRTEVVARDLHPQYVSTEYARRSRRRVVPVQHHHAHVLSCVAENGAELPVLGVAMDDSGYGEDGTIWGGEFLSVDETGYRRVAHFRTYRLPGGDRPMKEPRRSAAAVLYEIFGADTLKVLDGLFTPHEACAIVSMLQRRVHSPVTSSAGRLFDAVASLSGVRQTISYEGQAASELEFRAGQFSGEARPYPFDIRDGEPMVVDWEPMVRHIVAERVISSPEAIAARFHATLAEMIVAVAKRAGTKRLALSGNCFQNRLLTERTVIRLREEGFEPFWHRRVPPNDGGISLGQVLAASLVARRR